MNRIGTEERFLGGYERAAAAVDLWRGFALLKGMWEVPSTLDHCQMRGSGRAVLRVVSHSQSRPVQQARQQ